TAWGLSVLRAARNNRKKSSGAKTKTEPTREELETVYEKLVKRIAKISEKRGVTPILFFHQNLRLGKDGSASLPNNENLAMFCRICKREGVVFVDATERFHKEYEEKKVWPYGFCNAGIVSGHLNRDGCRIVADALEEKIRELEAENKENEAKQ
ncbi:MAG: hypothetical protein IKY61_08155, partial [Thermoguttaceae bacterium]|nr:hypothetical protein [Thermoguttaceae bacterium]